MAAAEPATWFAEPFPASFEQEGVPGWAGSGVLAATVGQATSGPPHSRGRRARRAMSAELIEQCMEVAREVKPELFERLERMQRESSGPEFERSIRQARHLVGLARLKQRRPKLYDVKRRELQLDAEIIQLLAEMRDARRTSSGSAEQLEQRLRVLVERQVGLSIASRGMYLKVMLENVERLREELEQDGANFSRAVERRFQELMEQTEVEGPDRS